MLAGDAFASEYILREPCGDKQEVYEKEKAMLEERLGVVNMELQQAYVCLCSFQTYFTLLRGPGPGGTSCC